MKRARLEVLVALVVVCFFMAPLGHAADKGKCKCPYFSSFYCKSLHFTGEGMRYWYEEQRGFMNLTGIPYNKLGCKKCHVTSCDKCHAVNKDGKMAFSLAKVRDMKTCFVCHGREALALKFDKQRDQLGVHFQAGMNCNSCHKGADVHGEGIMYHSMRAPGAVKANCMNCHKGGGDAPAFDPKLRAHRVHRGKLDCAACHVRSAMTCYNCHFSRFIATKSKKGNFIPMKSFLLLINYKGKVTAGNVMTLVYKGKKFIAYAPYFTHSVMAKGRDCRDCHGNKAMQLIKAGRKVPVVAYKNGQIVPWKGVVPAVPDKLEWVYLDKEGKKWVPLKGDQKEWVQFTDYGEPLTAKQLKRLMMPFGRRR